MTPGEDNSNKLVGLSTYRSNKLDESRKEVNELITQEGTLQITPEHGIQYSGFRFSKKLPEEQKCLEILDWGISYLQGMREQIKQEGMPPHPQASTEVFDFLKYRQSKVEMASSDTRLNEDRE